MDRVIYLMRHGHIDTGNVKRYIGITDLPLSSKGVEQIIRLKGYFSDIKLEKAYTSSLKRCVQTSEIMLDGRNIQGIALDELKEINMGDWENQPIMYIKEYFKEQYENRGKNLDTFVPPGGESFEQLQKRVLLAFEYINDATRGNVLIIGHAGVNRVILSGLLNFPLKDLFKIDQPYGCINCLRWDRKSSSWQWEQKTLTR
jgi:probable phosphoglycerate mutase